MPVHRLPVPVTSADGHCVEQVPVHDATQAMVFSDKVNETLQDVVTIQGETAVFECKMAGHAHPPAVWYKDGVVLTENYRTAMTADGPWRRLQIDRVQIADQGIYTVKCRYNDECVSSTARLFVAPRHLDAGALYNDWGSRELGVVKHLRNVDVVSGDRVVLEAHFKQTEEYVWVKNNTVISQDERTIILNDTYTSTLSIINAETRDTGVYFVVSMSKNGYVASHADVKVREHDEAIKQLPDIIEILPDEVEPFLGQEMRLNVKVSMDRHTIVRWQRDDSEIDDRTCEPVDYGSNYIGLHIPKPTLNAVGVYTVTLTSERTAKDVNTHTRLSVRLCPVKAPPLVKLVRPLESALAVIGSRVSFDCSFDLEDPIYFYVVWYVGHYKVERSNSLFNVLCGGGQYVLYIQKLLPDMEGRVTCQLRRAWPTNKSVEAARTDAYLAIVPLCVIREERKRRPDLLAGKLCYERHCDVSTRARPGHHVTPAASCPSNPVTNSPEPLEFLWKIIYSRLDEAGLCWVHARGGRAPLVKDWGRRAPLVNDRGERAPRTACFLRDDEEHVEPGDHTNVTVFQWSDTSPDGAGWYLVELARDGGGFLEAGVTSQPRFRVESPPARSLMTFRVSATTPLVRVSHSSVYIVAPPEAAAQPAPARPHKAQPMEAFDAMYRRTGDVIGAGAFGSVELAVHRRSGGTYAAKHVKNKTTNREEAVMREFEVMARLNHPNLIELIGFYTSKTLHIFVMDYCWGGELFDRIVDEEYIKEGDVVGYVRQLCAGLEYIHREGIVHLDVKPENMMCPHPNRGTVKLIDFGLARRVTSRPVRAMYGTKDYVAPEVLAFEPVSAASDMWSLGVVVYVCLSGLLPFAGDSWLECGANITRVNYSFDDFAFDEISHVAKDFINGLLVKQPRKRLSASGALAHRWLREGPPAGAAPAHMQRARANLKSYLADYRSKWQRARNVMIAAHRLRTRRRHDAPSTPPPTTTTSPSPTTSPITSPITSPTTGPTTGDDGTAPLII